MSKKLYLQKIKDNFPNLNFNQVRLICSGYDNDVVVLDKKIVFSFPKLKYDCQEKLQKQLKILPYLNKQLSLAIPNFLYIPKDKSFAGYKYITGVPLSNKIIKSLNIREKELIVKQIANFINKLHSFSLLIAKRNNVCVYNKALNKKIKPVLVHQDLIDEHILFDEKNKKIAGIIDFGDLVIADPALEFSRIWRYGESFLDLILKYYQTTDKDIKERSRLLWLNSQKNNLSKINF